MNEEIIKLIQEYKKASDKLSYTLEYNQQGETYKGLEEYRERVQTFCLSYDEHIMLNELTKYFNR